MKTIAPSEIKKMIRLYNRNPNDQDVSLAFDESSSEIIKIKADGTRHPMSPELFIAFYSHNIRGEKLTAMVVQDAQNLIDSRNAIQGIVAKCQLDLINGTVVQNLHGKETILPIKKFIQLFSTER